jgi:hypothetical protein
MTSPSNDNRANAIPLPCFPKYYVSTACGVLPTVAVLALSCCRVLLVTGGSVSPCRCQCTGIAMTCGPPLSPSRSRRHAARKHRAFNCGGRRVGVAFSRQRYVRCTASALRYACECLPSPRIAATNPCPALVRVCLPDL